MNDLPDFTTKHMGWLVCRENCRRYPYFDGFGCDRSPIVKENDEICRCDGGGKE